MTPSAPNPPPEGSDTSAIVGKETIEGADLEDLIRAVTLLENPSFIARVTDFVGQPIEQMIEFLPAAATDKLQDSVRGTLHKMLGLSIHTLGRRRGDSARTLGHRLAGGVSGAVGGFFGAPALAVELPLTTGIILRSIADIAQSEGEDLGEIETQLACLEVFALGGRAASDDGADTGYFAVRAALAKAVADAAKHIAQRGFTAEGAPVIARFIAAVASRFSSVVSEKIAAQAVPVIGAIGGAGVNLLFMNHFQNMARGHFIVRRLERAHGGEVVRSEYRQLAEQWARR